MQTHRLCTHYCKGGLQLNIFVRCVWQLNDGLPTVRKEIIFCGPTIENHKMSTYKKGSLSLMANSDRIHQLHAVTTEGGAQHTLTERAPPGFVRGLSLLASGCVTADK